MENLTNAQPKLEPRIDGGDWNIEFEQEKPVRNDLFEVDEDEEYELELDEE